MGNRYDVGDVVEVDGSIIKAPKKDKLIYIALYKPAGITTTSEAVSYTHLDVYKRQE